MSEDKLDLNCDLDIAKDIAYGNVVEFLNFNLLYLTYYCLQRRINGVAFLCNFNKSYNCFKFMLQCLTTVIRCDILRLY